MASTWENYTRMGLKAASTATSVGFTAAKMGTKLGFGIARTVATTAVGVAAYPFGMGALLGGAVSTVFSLAEHVALAPILLGETLTSTSLVAAESSIDVLSAIFPGSDEASFSLASFVALVRREWNEPALWEQLPQKRYSIMEIGKALIAWGALQGVTHEWKEDTWFKVLKELSVNDDDELDLIRERRQSRIRITSDATFPSDSSQIITAEIEDALDPSSSYSYFSNAANRISHSRLKQNLRRFSKMVLAGYGGAGLIFFGVSLTPPPLATKNTTNPLHENAQTTEAHALADAIDASEKEASSSKSNPAPPPPVVDKAYSWWNVLLGRHDREIFEGYAFTPATTRERRRKRRRGLSQVDMGIGDLTHDTEGKGTTEKVATAVVGQEPHMPRYWVLTDHGRKQVVLVFRGTFSVNELAVDLTCEPESFTPARLDGDPVEDDGTQEKRNSVDMPGSLPFPGKTPEVIVDTDDPSAGEETYQVHGGMLRMARAMGARGKPVHQAVQQALRANKGYELILTGHSLGAGVAALLALIWANPKTSLTAPSSGLPVGRRVTAYCFAPPCLVCPALSVLSRKMITSFVYSNDVVSRLSLGSVRDMNRVAAWLCEANTSTSVEGSGGRAEGYTEVTKRVLKWKAGYGYSDDPEWFLAMRKTLEANMVMADLFPPGRVLWAIRDAELCPAHQLNPSSPLSPGSPSRSGKEQADKNGNGEAGPSSKVRLFEVLDVEKMFGQMIFARDMLSSHLPHQYDRILHELL